MIRKEVCSNKTTKPSILIQLEEGKYQRVRGPAIHTITKKRRNPRLGPIIFEKLHTKFEEEEKKWKIEKLKYNKIMVKEDKGLLVILKLAVNHNNYIKEEDVTLPCLDEDWRRRSYFGMPPLPPKALVDPSSSCTHLSCRLGCICESIGRKENDDLKLKLDCKSKTIKKKKKSYGDIKFRLRRPKECSFSKCDCMKTNKGIHEKNIKFRLRRSRVCVGAGNKCFCCDAIL
jgi:hypothetical protein